MAPVDGDVSLGNASRMANRPEQDVDKGKRSVPTSTVTIAMRCVPWPSTNVRA